MSNKVIDLDSLLEQIANYEYNIILKIYQFVDIYDKQEKEEYIWRCVKYLQNGESDVIQTYHLSFSNSWEETWEFITIALAAIFGVESFNYDQITGRFHGCVENPDEKEIKKHFEQYGDVIIRLTHFMWFDDLWPNDDDIENEMEGQCLANFIKNIIFDMDEKYKFDTSFLKIEPTDYYNIKLCGYNLTDIDYKTMCYKNIYGFNLDTNHNDMTFIHHNKCDISLNIET